METVPITKIECEAIIKKFLQNDQFQIESYEIQPFHKPLEGLIGEHFTLQIEYLIKNVRKSQQFFVKTLNKNPVMFELSSTVDVYPKEKFFYTFLLEEFKKHGIDHSFAPEAYLFVSNTVVLEDLALENYKGTEKRDSLDLDHLRVCLATIAKFHWASMKYQKLSKKSLVHDHSKILEDKFFTNETNGATQWIKCSIQGVYQLIDLVPENHVTKQHFRAELGKLLEDFLSKNGVNSDLNSVLHGDLWSANFLYLYENEKPVKAKLVDFQTIKYGPVQLDVVQFIMSNTRRNFRTQNFDSLLAFYFEKLREHDLDFFAGLSIDDFVQSCQIFKLPAKIHTIVDRSLTFMPDWSYQEAMKSEQTFRRFMFEERGKYIMDCFRSNQQYREVLLEDVVELRDLLFPDQHT